jgi:hypothetical protein
MILDVPTPSCKPDSPVRLDWATIEPKQLAAHYIMTRFDVSPSLACTIAALAQLGGAP